MKSEIVNEGVEGKIIEKQEENHCLRNLNQELEERNKKLKNNMYTTTNESKDCESRKKVTGNMYTATNKLQDVTLSWKCNNLKKIELRWINLFSFRKLCSTLTISYHHVATIMTKYTANPKVKKRNILQ